MPENASILTPERRTFKETAERNHSAPLNVGLNRIGFVTSMQFLKQTNHQQKRKGEKSMSKKKTLTAMEMYRKSLTAPAKVNAVANAAKAGN